jgi:biotin operon repressor
MQASLFSAPCHALPYVGLGKSTQAVLDLLTAQKAHGVSSMDALRALGMAGGSFTKRVSELRRAGYTINQTKHCDPISHRLYSRYWLV